MHNPSFMKDASLPADFIQLAQNVRLRREHFGGLAFDASTGNTVEVDRGAFRLMEFATAGISEKRAFEMILNEGLEPQLNERDVTGLIQELLGLGVLVAVEPIVGTVDPTELDERPWPSGPPLVGPEAVHWAITYRCHAACLDCYAERHRRAEAIELSTTEALQVVDRVAEWGAFQLAIGGGEPLLRNDLPTIVRHAREQGLSVHVTTSGEVTSGMSDGMLEDLSCLQIGIRHDDLLNKTPTGQLLRLPEICRRADELGVNVGANLVLCRTVVNRFEDFVDLLVKNDFRRITLLRYKPPTNVERWLTESPERDELREMETRIGQRLKRKPGVAIRLDCALAFLERHLSSVQARRAGLRGCVAGSRIVALSPDGSVYPCSQLVAPQFRGGNLLETSPAEIWRTSKVLRKCRNRRGQRKFRQTLCGSCHAIEQCGGCLAMSDTGFGADPGCPEPLLPPLGRLGPDGRVADLREYLRSFPTISVGEYMTRYGVGQKRAISELRRFPGLDAVAADGDSRRRNIGQRKDHQYELHTDDVVGDIQDAIGNTSWGFPCATREQIANSLGVTPRGTGYPGWLNERVQIPVVGDEGDTLPAEAARKLQEGKGSE